MVEDLHDVLAKPFVYAHIARMHEERVNSLAVDNATPGVHLHAKKRAKKVALAPDSAEIDVEAFRKRLDTDPLRILRYVTSSMYRLLTCDRLDANAAHYIRRAYQSDQNALTELVICATL